MNSPPHHLHSTHLASARTAPRGERREFRTDQRVVRSIARTAREGLGSQPRASRLLSPLARPTDLPRRPPRTRIHGDYARVTTGDRVPVIAAEVGVRRDKPAERKG